jgi:REP element-mobilizing transposase RayT
MPYHPDIHHRRSIRLTGYDYTRAGAYFVTICAYQRQCLFGEVKDGVMVLNEYGMVVQQTWHDLPNHFQHVVLDQFVIMPNHVHGVIVFGGDTSAHTSAHSLAVGAQHAAPLQNPHVISGSLGAAVRSFKSAVTKRINTHRNTPGHPVWQRNYYEHVIRDDRDLAGIRQYIVDNAARWVIP